MNIDFTKDALDYLSDLKEPKRYRQVVSKILSLLKDPFPSDSQELIGYDARRATIGEYRIIYRYDEPVDTLRIIVIGKRNDGEVYKNLN
jgi:mRNA interferase RelE/StbE